MDDILDVLAAHGVPGATIVRVAKLIAEVARLKTETEILDRQRDAARERMRVVRERSRTVRERSEHDLAFLSKEEKIYPKKESKKDLKKESRGRAKTPLPPDWQPIGHQRDPAEADEFRDHALAKGYRYSDWHAAYRNFQRSPYNPRNKPGAPQPGIAEAERVVMLEEFHRAQLSRRKSNASAEKPRSSDAQKL